MYAPIARPGVQGGIGGSPLFLAAICGTCFVLLLICGILICFMAKAI